jgi:putative DNA primase/helicase
VRERFQRRGIELHVCANLRVGITDDDRTLYAYTFDDEGNCTNYKKAIHCEGVKTEYVFNTASRLFPDSMLEHDDLVLCEGESDMLCLLSHGINAITNTAGAGTFKPEWAAQLAGKAVTILYDNDTAGREGTQRVVQYLSKTAKSLVIARLPDDAKDVGAFFEQGGTIEQLHEILLSAQPVQREPASSSTESRTPPETFERIPIFSENGRLIHRAVADTIVAQYDLCATDAGATTTFYEYADGYWKQISPRIIRKTIQDVIGDVATHSHIRSVLEIIADRVYVDERLLDVRNDLLNLQNCAFDLVNYKPVPHNKTHYFSHKTTYEFSAEADCPIFHQALETYSMRDNDWIKAFWEILGYCLTGGYEFQKMFWFFGGGANGKGTVLRIMQNLVGTFYTRASIKPKQLDDQFYKSGLINKRLAIAGEIPTKLANISAIKELSGGDRQSTDVKYGQQVDFENKAKLVFAMNRMPTFPSTEPLPPIMRRIYLLPFEHRITTQSPDIEKRFEAEMSGIFNHAIKGLQRLRRQGEFTICERGKRQLNLYAGEINTFAAFLHDKCSFAPKCSAWGYELWESYQAYMEYNCGITWRTDRDNVSNMLTFNRELASRYDVAQKREYCRDKRGTMQKVYGVALKQPETEPRDESYPEEVCTT